MLNPYPMYLILNSYHPKSNIQNPKLTMWDYTDKVLELFYQS